MRLTPSFAVCYSPLLFGGNPRRCISYPSKEGEGNGGGSSNMRVGIARVQ